jgi:hypothetical protein
MPNHFYITPSQRRALKRVYDRAPIYPSMGEGPKTTPVRPHHKPLSYRQFRMYVSPAFDGSGAVMVRWCGMWLGIEKDGYTHS